MTTATTTINDRVPAIKLYESLAQSEQTSSANISADNTLADETVTATYTISAPTTVANKTDASVQGEKISATYTIPTPVSSSLISPTKKQISSTTKPSSVSSNLTGENSHEDNLIETPTISATISVPLCNNKTDFDKAETRVPSPTSSKTNVKFDAKYNNKLPTSVVMAVKQDSTTDTDRDKQTAIEFTFSKPNREKRSLLDLDNASSLSLADKLRNEADKYSETSRSNNDVSSMSQQQSAGTAGSAISDANEIERKYDSTPSSPMHHITAERRPSWRLKIDAGSKVRKRYYKQYS